MKWLILNKPENPDFNGIFLPIYTQVVCFISLNKKRIANLAIPLHVFNNALDYVSSL